MQALAEGCNELLLPHLHPSLCWWIWCCGSGGRPDSGRKISPPASLRSLCCTWDAVCICRSFSRGASASEEDPIFELWIIHIWGNSLFFSSLSPLRSSLSPQSHLCLPCYCCTSSLCTPYSWVSLQHPLGAAANFKPGMGAAPLCPTLKQGRGSYWCYFVQLIWIL